MSLKVTLKVSAVTFALSLFAILLAIHSLILNGEKAFAQNVRERVQGDETKTFRNSLRERLLKRREFEYQYLQASGNRETDDDRGDFSGIFPLPASLFVPQNESMLCLTHEVCKDP
jgi:hypothetical protein